MRSLDRRLGHLAASLGSEAVSESVHVGSGDKLVGGVVRKEFHEFVCGFGADGLFESVE